MRELRVAVSTAPGDFTPLEMLGDVLLQAGDAADALKCFEQAACRRCGVVGRKMNGALSSRSRRPARIDLR